MPKSANTFAADVAVILPSRWVRTAAISSLALIALLPIAVAIPDIARSDDPLAAQIGAVFGLLAFGLMTLQIVIGSRPRVICDPIGLGQLLRVHRLTGVVVLALLLAHPLLVSLGRDKPELLNPLRAPWAVMLGQAALLLLIAHSVLAIFRTKFSIDYAVWRRIHRVAYLIFALGFAHGFVKGDDWKRHYAEALWVLILAGTSLLVFHARFIKPRVLHRTRHRITEIIRENHNTTTLVLTPEAGARFNYLPGQFMFLTPLRPNLPPEEHPFTISSSPTQPGILSATIKSVGDFTACVQHWQSGKHILVDGPHGKFSYLFHPHANRLVFVAGGVGITPMMSMLRFLRDTGDDRPVRLIYANRTEADILFRDELSRLESETHLRLTHLLSNPSVNWQGERGRISREFLSKFIDEERDATYYVCGPPALMKSIVADLQTLQIIPSRIHSETFSI